MNKRLIPATPYIPVGGVNWDQPGINLADTQMADILNMRIFADRLETRSGCRRIATVAPSGNPILHMARYKKPNGAELLFGFTKNNIYAYDDTLQEWTYSCGTYISDACTSLDKWERSTDPDTSATWALIEDRHGSSAAALELSIDELDFTGEETYNMFSYVASSPLTINAGYIFSIWYKILWEPADHFSPSQINLAFYSDASYTVAYEVAVWFPTTGIDFAHLTLDNTWRRLDVTLPAIASVHSFGFKFIDQPRINYGHVGTYAFSFDDLLIKTPDTISDITHWSTTEFTDDDLGMTLVAAGSQIPKPNEAETDGGARILLYYDKNLGYFKKLKQRIQDIATIDEVLSIAGGTTFSGILTHFPIAEATLEITDGTQVVADLTRNGILTSTLDGDTVSGGIINYETGAYIVTFKNAVVVPAVVTATYDYYEDVTSLPRYITNFHNRLVGFNFWDGVNYTPWHIAWSDVGSMNLWHTDNFIDSLDSDISSYRAIASMGQYLVLYKEHSIEFMTYTGSTSTFGLQTVLHEGIFAGRTVVSRTNKHYFLGKENVYMFDGSTLTPLATDRVRKRIFDVLNIDGINTCFGYYYEYFNEYWLWITRADEDYPTAVFVYNTILNAWSYFEFAATTCMSDYHLTAADTIDELVGTIDEQNWKLDSGSLEGSLKSPMIAREIGDVFALDERMNSDYGYTDSGGTWHAGDAIPIRLVTRDFIYQQLHRKDRTQLIHFEARGDEIDVSWSHDFGRSFNDVQTVTLTPEYDRFSYFPDVAHQYIRFKFEATGLDQYFSLRWVETFSITEEKP